MGTPWRTSEGCNVARKAVHVGSTSSTEFQRPQQAVQSLLERQGEGRTDKSGIRPRQSKRVHLPVDESEAAPAPCWPPDRRFRSQGEVRRLQDGSSWFPAGAHCRACCRSFHRDSYIGSGEADGAGLPVACRFQVTSGVQAVLSQSVLLRSGPTSLLSWTRLCLGRLDLG
jgi:hypothetical protein